MRKVLVVEDDLESRFAISGIIKNRFKCRVTEASSVLEALDAINSQVFDCIVSDVEMPIETGIDLARKLSEKSVSIPVFFYTATDLRAKDLAQFDRVVAAVNKPHHKHLIELMASVLGWQVENPKHSD